MGLKIETKRTITIDGDEASALLIICTMAKAYIDAVKNDAANYVASYEKLEEANRLIKAITEQSSR